MMEKFTSLILFTLLGVMQSNVHAIDSTFHNLVCKQSNSWSSMVTAFVNMTALEELIEIKIEEVLNRRLAMYSSCRGVNLASAKSQNETGGVFDITIPGVGTKEVYCNTEIDGGGWIVFQRRMDGSVDFYRNWNEYVVGFGDVRGEYWLGLKAIHQLTKNGGVELRIDMIEQNETYYYAKYNNFQIGSASDNYRLSVSGYSGNATDQLGYHNNQQFTTKDRDNDRSTGQCAHYHDGAWWYNRCAYSSLNGVYERTDRKRVYWIGINNIKFTEIKLRKKI